MLYPFARGKLAQKNHFVNLREVDNADKFCANVRKPIIMSTPNSAISTDSLMQETRAFPPAPDVISRAHLNAEQYGSINAFYKFNFAT